MISIILSIIAVIILVLRQFGIIKNPLSVFLIATVILVALVFGLKDRINCPFAKKCPFTSCPLNKTN